MADAATLLGLPAPVWGGSNNSAVSQMTWVVARTCFRNPANAHPMEAPKTRTAPKTLTCTTTLSTRPSAATAYLSECCSGRIAPPPAHDHDSRADDAALSAHGEVGEDREA